MSSATSTRAASPSFVILEDHALVREGLMRSISEAFPGARYQYSGDSLGEALRATSNESPDCAIIDLDLGDGRSVAEVVSSFAMAEIPVVVVSAMGEPAIIQSAILAGASAYVTKRSGLEELHRVLEAVLSGTEWMTPEFAAALIPQKSTDVRLSSQEQRALVLYASGLKLDSVARRMGVAPSTVKQYLDRVRDKYTSAGQMARTKADLYRVARHDGLLP